jgi:hypothetical protein
MSGAEAYSQRRALQKFRVKNYELFNIYIFFEMRACNDHKGKKDN